MTTSAIALLRTPLVLLACITLLTAVGCAKSKPWGLITINRVDADAAPETPIAVDIDNRFGSVAVHVDPDLTEPQVTASVPSPQGPSRPPEWIAAEIGLDNNRPILRVLTATPSGGEPKFIDLVVRVPAILGVRVRNSGGPVVLVDVEGAIDVQTSANYRGAKSITLSTSKPLSNPLLLRSSLGRVSLKVPRASAGRLVARAPDGTVSVDAAGAALDSVVFNRKQWSGRLNSGDAEMSLVADEGDIFVTMTR